MSAQEKIFATILAHTQSETTQNYFKEMDKILANLDAQDSNLGKVQSKYGIEQMKKIHQKKQFTNQQFKQLSIRHNKFGKK